MDVWLNRDHLYAIADALGMTLEYDPKQDVLSGVTQRQVNIGDLPVTFTMRVVSAHLTSAAYMVMAKVVGNLAVFITVKDMKNGECVDLHILNLAKMDKAEGWLERIKPKSVNDALRVLDKAVVRSFVKIRKNEWATAA
jgi:hypothetical protein